MNNYKILFDDRRLEAEAVNQGQLVPAPQGAPLIAALIDRSGSMASCLTSMQDALNEFIRDQPGAAVMLGQFDHEYELIWPLQAIAGAPNYRLNPRGRTALYDGIGEFVTEVADALGADTEYRKVVCVIVTDGAENSSKEWTRDTVADLIHYWRTNYQWEFVFLGANIDAVATADKFGIPEASALTFDTKKAKASMQILGRHVHAVRNSKPAGFTADDRRKAIGQ